MFVCIYIYFVFYFLYWINNVKTAVQMYLLYKTIPSFGGAGVDRWGVIYLVLLKALEFVECCCEKQNKNH